MHIYGSPSMPLRQKVDQYCWLFLAYLSELVIARSVCYCLSYEYTAFYRDCWLVPPSAILSESVLHLSVLVASPVTYEC